MMYTEQEARRLIIEAGHRLLEEQLAARTWGNISARISQGEFIITPSGRAYDTLQPEDLVLVSLDDGTCTGNYPPSSEYKLHAMIYNQRPKAGFVLHTHQLYASAVGAEGQDKPYAPCAAYGTPGSAKLTSNIEQKLIHYPQHQVFLMEKHGAVAIGKDFEEAFSEAEALERNCKTTFEARVSLPEKCGELPAKLPEGLENPYVYTDPIITAYCRRAEKMKPWIDDFAMLIGTDAEITDSTPPVILKGLKNRNAVLLYRGAAVCTGATPEDAQAAALILTKNCAAALYARKARPLNILRAGLERTFYLAKYSKQKDE